MTKIKFMVEDGKITFSKGRGHFSIPLVDECLWIVDMGSTTGALIVKRYRVVECTPFLKRYFIGKKIKEAREIIENKGWGLKVIERENNNEIRELFERNFNKQTHITF